MKRIESLSSLKEELAAIEHDRWAHWQKYMHEKCIENEDGSLTIPKEIVGKWNLQIATPYSALSEKAKDSDREQVDKYLPTIKEFFGVKD